MGHALNTHWDLQQQQVSQHQQKEKCYFYNDEEEMDSQVNETLTWSKLTEPSLKQRQPVLPVAIASFFSII